MIGTAAAVKYDPCNVNTVGKYLAATMRKSDTLWRRKTKITRDRRRPQLGRERFILLTLVLVQESGHELE